MALQYDKQDILESCVPKFDVVEIPMSENQTKENTVKKEQYKCEIQYGKFLSHTKDELNQLKSSYANMLKIILKSVNTQVIKQLQELQPQNYFKMVDVQNNKKTQIKQITVKGSGNSFQEKCYEIIHKVLQDFQEKVIDTKDKKT